MFAIRHYWRLFALYLIPDRGKLALLVVSLFAAVGLQLFVPQIISQFLNAASSQVAQPLMGFAIAYLGIALLQRICALGSVYLGENLGWQATNRLRRDLASHVLKLDMSFHKQHAPGALIEQIDGDATALANFFSQFSGRILSSGLLLIGILALLWREDWRLGIGLTCYVVLAIGLLGGLQNLAVRRWNGVRESETDQYSFLEEHLSGTEDIRANGAEGYVLNRFDQLMHSVATHTRGARLTANAIQVSTRFLTLIGYTGGLIIGASLYLRGDASIGSAVLIVSYIGMLTSPMEQLRSQAEDLQRAGASVERISALLEFTPRIQEKPSAQLPDGPLGLECTELSFTYQDEAGAQAPVLDALSFALKPGEVLGLLGRTGSGKTTLMRLIARFYDPQQGSLRLAGHDLRDLALRDLRSHVGIVTQDVQLFHASLRENLRLFDTTIDDARLQAALQELGLWQWAQSLPQALDTIIGGSQGLSAGEAQLLAFARVFLRNPGLIILDEASSRLDPATETLLEQAITRLLEGRSAIIIAHRLQTVQRADTIMIMEHGRIVEYGSRARLATSDSRFAQLLRTGMSEVLA